MHPPPPPLPVALSDLSNSKVAPVKLGVSEVLPLGFGKSVAWIFQRSTEDFLGKGLEWGVYLLRRPVPAWVGLDIVLNDVTEEKGGRIGGYPRSVSVQCLSLPHMDSERGGESRLRTARLGA